MVYQWDAVRARRVWVTKIFAVLFAAAVTAGLPIWIVAKAISL
jgi:hypothetical protein